MDSIHTVLASRQWTGETRVSFGGAVSKSARSGWITRLPER
jgi:hypothetical protein